MAHSKVYGFCDAKCKVQVPTVLDLPVGIILPFMGKTAPRNYFLCDGSEYDTDEYPELYEVLESNLLPDLRNRFLQGANNNLGANIEAGLPNITGSFGYIRGDSVELSSADGAFDRGNIVASKVYTYEWLTQGQIITINASKGETKTDGTVKSDEDYKVYGKSDTVQPPAFTVNYIIKARS